MPGLAACDPFNGDAVIPDLALEQLAIHWCAVSMGMQLDGDPVSGHLGDFRRTHDLQNPLLHQFVVVDL
jgi:hypothetical protein